MTGKKMEKTDKIINTSLGRWIYHMSDLPIEPT